MNLSTTELKETALHKTIEFLRRKKTHPTISELADQVLTQAEKLEWQNVANGTGGGDESSEMGEKSASTKTSNSTNTGVKRIRDDADNGGKADGAVKKPSTIVPLKPASASTSSKISISSAVKPTAAQTSSTITASTTLPKTKPTASSSTFFKSMASLGAAARPVTKPPTPYVSFYQELGII